MHAPADPGPRGDDARDKSLLRRAQRGEAPALAELMRHHLPRAWRVCLVLTLDRDEAEALLIEVARTFWGEALTRGPGLDTLTAITRLARARAAMTVLRRAGEAGQPVRLMRPDGHSWGEASPYDAQYEQRLLTVFTSWTTEDRLLLALRTFERLPLADVARTLAPGATEPADRMAMLRLRLEAAMRGEEPKSASGEHLSPLLLSASLDGTFAGSLKADGHEMVASHLAKCTQCRDLSARLRRHEEGLRRLLAFDPGEAYFQDLGNYLDQLIDAVAKGRHLPLRRVQAEVVETATEAPSAPAAPAAAAAPAVPAPEGPGLEMHATLDALMAELGKGFESPRPVTRAPIEPPRTAGEVMKPPSRELPRPVAALPPPPPPPSPSPSAPPAPAEAKAVAPAPAPLMPATPPEAAEPKSPPPVDPSPVPRAPASAPPPAVPDSSRKRRATDLEDTIIVAHRSRSSAGASPAPPAPSAPELERTVEPVRSPEPAHAEVAREPAASRKAAPAPARPTAPRTSRALIMALAAALVAVLALYALPPVIKVSMPDVPSPRLPRIELVREGRPAGQGLRASAESRAPLPERTDPARPSRGSSEARSQTAAAAATSPPAPREPARRDAAAAPPARVSTPALSRTANPPKPAVTEAPPKSEPARAVAEPPAAPVPSTRPSAAAPQSSSPAIDTEAEWPLLCGEVLDELGQPVAGARVLLADLDLGARTDRRGRFCIAAPVGDRTLSVSAQGFATLRRLVSLGRQGGELSLRLEPGP